MKDPFLQGLSQRSVVRWKGAGSSRHDDPVAVEEPLEIWLNDCPFAVTMRTPGQDRELVAGLLVSEGVLAGPSDLLDITLCAHNDYPDSLNLARVYIPEGRLSEKVHSPAHRFATSGCGLCGRERIAEAVRRMPPLRQVASVRREALLDLPGRLRAAQQLFGASGGLHAACLFSMDMGETVFEDVGRHNAVDKAIGDRLLRGAWPIPAGVILMVSGRAGFEIVQKAASAGIGTVCSVSAPSSLAVDLANEVGMILVGFLRGDTMNVYSGESLVL